jgi:DNA modification methylase
LIKAATMPNDIVLIHFGGSGSEIEVCQRLNRNFIAAEIDPKYYKMIIDRLTSGMIEEKYRLIVHKKDISTQQLRLIEPQKLYEINKEK